MGCGCGCDGAHRIAYWCENCNVFFGLPADFSTDNYTLIQLASADRKGAPLVANNVVNAPCGCIQQFIYQLLVVERPNAIDRTNCPPPLPTPVAAPSCCVTITPVPIVPLLPEVPEPATPPPPGPCDCVTLPQQRNADRTYYRYPWPDLF